MTVVNIDALSLARNSNSIDPSDTPNTNNTFSQCKCVIGRVNNVDL